MGMKEDAGQKLPDKALIWAFGRILSMFFYFLFTFNLLPLTRNFFLNISLFAAPIRPNL